MENGTIIHIYNQQLIGSQTLGQNGPIIDDESLLHIASNVNHAEFENVYVECSAQQIMNAFEANYIAFDLKKYKFTLLLFIDCL